MKTIIALAAFALLVNLTLGEASTRQLEPKFMKYMVCIFYSFHIACMQNFLRLNARFVLNKNAQIVALAECASHVSQNCTPLML